MPRSNGASVSQHNHLEALRARHAALEEQIHEEQKFPAVNMMALRELKRQKLRIKEEIEHYG